MVLDEDGRKFGGEPTNGCLSHKPRMDPDRAMPSNYGENNWRHVISLDPKQILDKDHHQSDHVSVATERE